MQKEDNEGSIKSFEANIIKNKIFISYAGDNREIAQYISDEINKQIEENFYCQLVENRKEGDTTFTEKIIDYFKNCNVFIVILTKKSIQNQFVNQEWGYAKALKELGQIQLIQHIIEKHANLDIAEKEIHKSKEYRIDYDKEGRIISRGFIANNMEFIDLVIDGGSYKYKECALEVISFLKGKQSALRPITTERQQKLRRFINENDRNITIIDNLVKSIKDLRERGSLDPDQLSYDYALQIINIAHLFNHDFISSLEDYVIKCKRLNAWKDLQIQWIVCKSGLHKGNVEKYTSLLHEFCECCINMKDKLNNLEKLYFS